MISILKRRTKTAINLSLCYGGVLFFILFCIQFRGNAAEVTLQWDANTESDLAGYKLYYDTDSGVPYSGSGATEGDSPITIALNSLNTPDNPEFKITGLDPSSNFYFVLTAYDTEGLESDYSNEVSFLMQSAEDTTAEIQPSEEDTSAQLPENSTTEIPPAETGISEPAIVNLIAEEFAITPSVEIVDSNYSKQTWMLVDWVSYYSNFGAIRVALGDIDGDKRDEIIIGLGSDHIPENGSGVFQILDDDYSHLAWGQVNWPDYNVVNGEIFPACCDVDGDGVDEILVGLGFEGGGRIEVFVYNNGSAVHLKWLNVEWDEYNQAVGETRPTCGDIDGDSKDEIIVGLGSDLSDPEISMGKFLILDDDYSHLAWGEIGWPDYNRINGESYPSSGDINGDGKDELFIGLGYNGEGRVEVLEYLSNQMVHSDWVIVDWPDYNKVSGETRPVTGNLDSDNRSELIIGLGVDPSDPTKPGSWFKMLDDNLSHLAWGGDFKWSGEDMETVESYPACGDMNGDTMDELVFGVYYPDYINDIEEEVAPFKTETSADYGNTASVENDGGGGGGCFIGSLNKL